MDKFTYLIGQVSEVCWPHNSFWYDLTKKFMSPKHINKRCLLSDKEKEFSYNFFLHCTVFEISEKIIYEMDKDKTNSLFWFSVGDCHDDNIEKILSVLYTISYTGIIQLGVTCNYELWKQANNINNCKFKFKDLYRWPITK